MDENNHHYYFYDDAIWLRSSKNSVTIRDKNEYKMFQKIWLNQRWKRHLALPPPTTTTTTTTMLTTKWEIFAILHNSPAAVAINVETSTAQMYKMLLRLRQTWTCKRRKFWRKQPIHRKICNYTSHNPSELSIARWVNESATSTSQHFSTWWIYLETPLFIFRYLSIVLSVNSVWKLTTGCRATVHRQTA